jgi:hypothetical protein
MTDKYRDQTGIKLLERQVFNIDGTWFSTFQTPSKVVEELGMKKSLDELLLGGGTCNC